MNGYKNRFRTLAKEGRTKTYPTRQECEEAAQKIADRTRQWCGIEEWSEEHPQDELNEGWALIGTRTPSENPTSALREALIVDDTLVCPYQTCGGVDTLVAHDRADRYSEIGTVFVEDGVLAQVTWHTGESNFHTQAYGCSRCGREVTLPGDPMEEWN